MKAYKSPAFQFYPDSWLSSMDITLMTSAEEGAYIRLLCHAWLSPDCGLPADSRALQTLSRLGSAWSKSEATIRAKFRQEDGRIYNDRLLAERSKQEVWREKSSAGGKRSGATRREANHEPKTKGGSLLVDDLHEPNGNSSSPSPFPVNTKAKTHTPTAAKTAAVSVIDPVEGWFSQEFWPAYPRREAKVAALKAARAVLKTPELRAAALRALTLQLPDLTSRPPDKRPHPATWINGRRWEDEAALPFISMPRSGENGNGKVGFVESVEREFQRRYEEGRL